MAYVFRQGDLPKLDLQVDRGTDFKAWKSQWDAYISLSGLDKQSQAKQVQALTLCFSRETVTIVDNLGLTGAQRGNAKEIITGIQRYVEGQINESVERRNFRRRSQQQGESFDDFLVSLRELAKTCNFCSDQCTQKNIRDQIIEGLMDGDTVANVAARKQPNGNGQRSRLTHPKRPFSPSEEHAPTAPHPHNPPRYALAVEQTSTKAEESNAPPTT